MSTLIYTDGSSRGNPGPGGWGAIIVDARHVQEIGGREDMTTNNRMEMVAAIEALTHAAGPVTVRTDSAYLLNGMTKWVSGWKRNGWKTAAGKDVENRDLWEKLSLVVASRQVNWEKVAGHEGVAGNERCDEIATGFADDIAPRLYSGPRTSYPVDLSSTKVSSGARKSSSRGQAYSYLSYVDGVLRRHESWTQCEERVKGVKGARFKKALSPEDEVQIMRSWGIDA